MVLGSQEACPQFYGVGNFSWLLRMCVCVCVSRICQQPNLFSKHASINLLLRPCPWQDCIISNSVMVKMNWLLHFFPLISLKFCSRGSHSCHLSTHLSPGLVCISLSSSFTWIPSPTHYNHKPLLGTVARCGVVYIICKSCSLTCVHPEVTQTDTLLEGPKFTLGCRDLLEKKKPTELKSLLLL